MPEFSMKLEGAEELLKKLKKLEAKTAKKVMQKGLRAGAKITLAAAKAKAPVKTGRLRRSLVARASIGGRKARRGTIQMLIFPSTKKEPGLAGKYKADRGLVGGLTPIRGRVSKAKKTMTWYYPAVIEFGTSTRPPNPFMRRAFDATKQQSAAEIIRVANQALMEEARK